MKALSDYILPAIIAFIAVFGALRGVHIFEAFTEGIKKNLKTVLGIVPAMMGLTVCVSMMEKSGALDVLCSFLSPVADISGIPKELLPLTILSPVSGGGALTMYESLLRAYGPDSLIGRTASIIMSSTETTFYALALYFGSAGIKKTRYTLPCAVSTDIISYILSSRLAGIL